MTPDEQISVTLAARQWEAVMQMLGEQPFKLSAGLIQAIQSQCMNYEVQRVQERHSRVSDESQ